MTSYLQEQLKNINENKKELEDKYIEIKKQIELDLEKNRILEMEGTIDKLKVQVNELLETISGNIMPNNIHIVHHQMKKDFKKDLDEWHKLQNSGKLLKSELETKRLILREKEINIRKETRYNEPRNINGFMNLLDDEKLITLEKFKDNLSKVDNETKNYFTNGRYARNELVEIKPEIKIYNDILPIFRTMIGIITTQQDK